MKRTIYFFLFSFSLTVVLLTYCVISLNSCAGDDGPDSGPDCLIDRDLDKLCTFVMDELRDYHPSVFPFLKNTNRIRIDSFQSDASNDYPGDTMAYELGKADLEKINCCNVLYYTGKMSNTPRLKWRYISNELMAVAIFKKPIRKSDHGISNVNDIVWLWHSGLGPINVEDDMIVVDFHEGRNVTEGKVDDKKLAPLDSNRVYFWGVWAWNSKGTVIERSSRQLPFVVNPTFEEREFSKLNQVQGTWKLVNLINLQDNSNAMAEAPVSYLQFYPVGIKRGGNCVTSLEVLENFTPPRMPCQVFGSSIHMSKYTLENVFVSCNYFTCEIETLGKLYLAAFERI